MGCAPEDEFTGLSYNWRGILTTAGYPKPEVEGWALKFDIEIT